VGSFLRVAEYSRRYREANKDKVAEKSRRYYEANKDKVAIRWAAAQYARLSGKSLPTVLREWNAAWALTERDLKSTEENVHA
jgi:hypothetical protein